MADLIDATTAIEGAVIEAAVQAGELALIAQFPFLGLPVIKQIWEFFVSRLQGHIVQAIQHGTNIALIDFQDAMKNKAAKVAAAKLQNVLEDPNHTTDQLLEAHRAFKDTYATLIRMRVAAQ